MERWIGSIAIVTGCTAGIGLAITKELFKHNILVVGLARRVEKLKSLEEEFPKMFYGIKCDLVKNEEILGAYKYVENNFGTASIVINNAGFLKSTSILDVEDETVRETLQTNACAVITSCREAVKAMMAKSIEGHIINISSIAGKMNFPSNDFFPIAVYSASKHALRSFTEDLRRELCGQKIKIKVSTISPGMVKTSMLDPLQDIYRDTQVLKPEDIAKACITVLNTPPNVVITDLTLKPMVQKYS